MLSDKAKGDKLASDVAEFYSLVARGQEVLSLIVTDRALNNCHMAFGNRKGMVCRPLIAAFFLGESSEQVFVARANEAFHHVARILRGLNCQVEKVQKVKERANMRISVVSMIVKLKEDATDADVKRIEGKWSKAKREVAKLKKLSPEGLQTSRRK